MITLQGYCIQTDLITQRKVGIWPGKSLRFLPNPKTPKHFHYYPSEDFKWESHSITGRTIRDVSINNHRMHYNLPVSLFTQIFVKQEKKRKRTERESLNISDLIGQINFICFYIYTLKNYISLKMTRSMNCIKRINLKCYNMCTNN